MFNLLILGEAMIEVDELHHLFDGIGNDDDVVNLSFPNGIYSFYL